MRWIVSSLALLVAFPAAAQDASKLIGTWKLVSITLQFEGEGATEFFGPNPRGYLILTREGRLMALLTADNRKQGTTEADQAALFASMNAYTGHYTLQGDTFVTKVEVASQAGWVGTDQVRHFKLDGNRLLLSAPPQPSARRSDHKAFTQEIVWERAE
jgi:hypothetical protein